MAHIERRVRSGRVSYRARYRDPAGREHAKVFARKADAQRFLTEMENSKLKGAWTDPALGRVLFREWFGEWHRALILLGTFGGLRIGEMAGLRRGRVDLDAGTVQVIEVITEPRADCTSARPRPAPAAGRSGCSGSWSKPWPSGWPGRARRRSWCSPGRRVGRCG